MTPQLMEAQSCQGIPAASSWWHFPSGKMEAQSPDHRFTWTVMTPQATTLQDPLSPCILLQHQTVRMGKGAWQSSPEKLGAA